jgi:hypothetical protein
LLYRKRKTKREELKAARAVLADREEEVGAKSHDSKTAWFSELIVDLLQRGLHKATLQVWDGVQ